MNAAWFENVLWNGQFGATGLNAGTDAAWTEGTPRAVNEAIAAHERALVANQAPFQMWLRGDDASLTDQQRLGASLFFGDAPAMTTGSAIQRTAAAAADQSSTWRRVDAQVATPGIVTADLQGAGLVITEVADSTGTGAYRYEFVEVGYFP